MSDYAQVFISYAREDYEAAKRLFDALRHVPEVEPWLDRENLLPGMNWERGIMLAIEESKFVVTLLSTRSTTKEGFVQREFKKILEKLEAVPEGRIAVIPARLDECVPPAIPLRKIHWVDLFPDWEKGVKRIMDAIRYEQTAAAEKVRPSIRAILRIAGPDPGVMEIQLDRAKVEEVIITDNDLSAVNLMSCNLSGLDLRSTSLRGANLVAADLKETDLREADLTGANLERASLIGAQLTCANLWGTNLWRANLHGVEGLELASSMEYTNFFGVEALSDVTRRKVEQNNITDLPDYGSFVDFFRNTVGMSIEEIKKVFSWLNHEYFLSVFERQL